MSLPALTNHPFTLKGCDATVILVHGLGGGTYELQRVGEALHERLGYTVHALHLPGHDVVQTWMPPSTHAQWTAAIHAAIHRALTAVPAGPVHVVGFSTGALAALRVAEESTWPGRLVLLAPLVRVYRPRVSPLPTEKLLSAFRGLRQVPRRPPPLRDKALRKAVTACLPFRTMNLAAAHSAVELAERTMRDLARVTLPTLIVQGDLDSVIDRTGADDIAAGLRCEHRVEHLPDSDHLVTLDRQGGRVIDVVVDFLSSPSTEALHDAGEGDDAGCHERLGGSHGKLP